MAASLTSQRLELRTFGIEDAAELHTLLGDPGTHTIGRGPHADVSETTAWIERRITVRRELGFCWYGLRLPSTGRLVGSCGIFTGRTGAAEPEIGYLVGQDSRGQGYAAEAAAAVLAECSRVRIERLWATVRPANLASVRILEGLGMTADHAEEDAKGTLLFFSRTLGSGPGRGNDRVVTIR